MSVFKALAPLLTATTLLTLTGCGATEQSGQTNKADGANAETAHNAADVQPLYAEEREVVPPQLSKEWLNKASLSFSPVKFGTIRTDIKPDLTRVVQDDCDEVEDCTYVDRNGVEYYFWEADDLVFKFIDAKRFKGRDIPAFGIGRARSKDDVLNRVEQFFDGARPLCYGHEEYGSKIACELDMGEGWTKLFFDGRDRLVYIRLDMAQID